MRRHGVADAVLTDKAEVFTGRYGPGKGEVLFDRICRENGIRHLLTAPRSPTTTGKIERFHKTLKAECLAERVFATIEEGQAAIDEWVEHYNTRRPHQGIGMVPPIERFRLARADIEVVEPHDESQHGRGDAVVAIVAGSVQLSVDGRVVKVHPIRHDPAKEHGAFANPNGRPRKPATVA